MSTTLFAPPNAIAEAIFSKLGTAVAVETFGMFFVFPPEAPNNVLIRARHLCVYGQIP
jgi:hypothetical protein